MSNCVNEYRVLEETMENSNYVSISLQRKIAFIPVANSILMCIFSYVNTKYLETRGVHSGPSGIRNTLNISIRFLCSSMPVFIYEIVIGILPSILIDRHPAMFVVAECSVVYISSVLFCWLMIVYQVRQGVPYSPHNH